MFQFLVTEHNLGPQMGRISDLQPALELRVSLPVIMTTNIFGEISGSHGGEYEYNCLLGCCAV
jgi:hypothetical protein